jgi:hypothetical protein
MEYVPYFELSGVPHVIADGSSRKATVLTLSHWPKSGTPWPLKGDLSAESAFLYLDSPAFAVEADAVSNDHLDLDGFIAVAALALPDLALAHRDLLIEVARAGDFATTTDDRARKIAFTLGALTDPERSTFDRAIFEQQRPLQVAALYRALLDELPALLADIDAYRGLWEQEEESFAASEAAIDAGAVTITEFPDADLAVVDLDPTARLGGNHRFCLQGWGPLNPIAVHNRTSALRIIYAQGKRYGLLYRFESWVQLVSRRPAPRIELAELAAALTASERDGATWSWGFPNNPNPPIPWLRTDDLAETTIDRDDFVARVRDFLSTSTSTIDQYDADPYGSTVDLTRR